MTIFTSKQHLRNTMTFMCGNINDIFCSIRAYPGTNACGFTKLPSLNSKNKCNGVVVNLLCSVLTNGLHVTFNKRTL